VCLRPKTEPCEPAFPLPEPCHGHKADAFEINPLRDTNPVRDRARFTRICQSQINHKTRKQYMKLVPFGGSRFRLLAVLWVAALMTGFAASSARASLWQLQDDFELNAPSTWHFEHSAVGGGFLDSSGVYSRSPKTDAYVYVTTGFSSVGRIVSFTPFLPGRTLNAFARIYLRPWGTNVKVNFEVIDPATWTYVSLKTVTLANSPTYQAVTTDLFVPYKKEVYVRVSVLAGNGTQIGVEVDDLTVQAQYY